MKKLFYAFPILWIFIPILFFSCSEEPIPYDLSETPLYLDSLTLYNKVSGFTYQVPPEMWNLDKLYLGDDRGFKNEFILLQISSLSMSDGTPLSSLLADTVTIDSAFLILTFTEDSIPESNPEFQLSFFTNVDSIFDEYDSNYNNFSIDNYVSEQIGDDTYLSQAEPDSDEVITPSLIFDVTNSREIIADTASSRSFFIKLVDDYYESLLAFNSRETNTGPRLSVYYRKFIPSESDDKDTLTLGNIFYAVKDVSIVEPPDSIDYANDLYVGRAYGLKSILNINLDTLQSLPAQTVFRSESYLNLPYDTTLIADKITVEAYLLADTVDPLGSQIYDEDPYSIHLDYDYLLGTTSWNQDEGLFSINIQPLLQYVHFGELENLGIKLYSDRNNDPFKTVNFSNFNSENDSINNPYISIQYVEP